MKKIFFLFYIVVTISCLAWGKYDENGFDKQTSINKETGTLYDELGYDVNGYDINGYNKEGYNKYGFDKNNWSKFDINKYTQTKYDKDGYDKYGYNRNGWNKDSLNKITGIKYDKDGYDEWGYNENGYDIKGYGRDGYNKNGWNKDNLNKITRMKYDENGYDKDGYDKNGWNKDNSNKVTGTKYNRNGYDYQGYNSYGYNENGYGKDGWSKEDWNKDNLNKATGTKYDKNGYDRNGFNKFGINKDTNDFYDINRVDFMGYDIIGNFKDTLNSKEKLSLDLQISRDVIFNKTIYNNYLDELNEVIKKLSHENSTEVEKKYLEIAVSKKDILQKETIQSIKEIEKNYDEFEKINWYSTKYNKDRDYENYPGVYIGEKNKNIWIVLNFTYYSSDWLFIKKIIIKSDSDMLELYPMNNDVVRNVRYGGNIEEMFESDITKNITRVKKIVNSNSFKIRLEGDNYYKDFDFSKNEIIKENINSIINKYYELKK